MFRDGPEHQSSVSRGGHQSPEGDAKPRKPAWRGGPAQVERLIFFALIPVVLLIAGQQRPTSRPAASTSRPASDSPGPRIVDFGDGIRINYIEHQVEVAGKVILREGPLELFAYSKAPAPKEHESIVLVPSKPERVFMALGLIGATPGKPMRWFAETQTLRNATGDPIDVLVRYGEGKSERTVHATDWMIDASTKKPMPPTNWIFCGSERSESGEFAANMEGTLVTVVDFATSLLALPQQHSDSDSELWLMANESAIPPTGTPVTILLRPLSTLIQLRLVGSDDVLLDGQRMPRKDLVDAVQRRTAGWVDRAAVEITKENRENAQSGTERALLKDLEKIGIGGGRVSVKNEGDASAPRPSGMGPTSRKSSMH